MVVLQTGASAFKWPENWLLLGTAELNAHEACLVVLVLRHEGLVYFEQQLGW